MSKAMVAEQSQAEFLASVLDHLDEGVYFVDLERRIALWNRAAETITGWPAASVLGRRCADGVLGHCDGDVNILCGSGCPLVAAMGDGESRTARAFMLRRDGVRVPVRVRAMAMRDAQGTVNGCVEVFNSDADRLAVLDEIQQLRDEAITDPLTGADELMYESKRRGRNLVTHG